MKYLNYLCLLLLMLGSFTKDLDLAWPREPPQLVLNGILHPDSTIQISLSTTIPLTPKSTDFPIVDNATVTLYEDDKLLEDLVFRDSVYVLDYHPKAGSKYTIEADATGYPTVRASDVVPNPPQTEACYREDTARLYPFSDAIINLAIDDPEQRTNYYWLHIVNTYPEYSRCSFKPDSVVWENGERHVFEFDTIVCEDNGPPTFQKFKAYYYESFSPIPDRFNGFVDNSTNGVTVYEGMIRVEDATFNGETIAFDLAIMDGAAGRYEDLQRYPRINSQLTIIAAITNASSHYDRYLKSSIIEMRNRDYNSDEEIGFKPFVQSGQVYSNIENGTGIFAAYNSTSIRLEQYPCE